MSFFHTTVYVNTCLVTATGQEHWQRRPSDEKSTSFSIASLFLGVNIIRPTLLSLDKTGPSNRAVKSYS